MNTMNRLIVLADTLDNKGLTEEANTIDKLITEAAKYTETESIDVPETQNLINGFGTWLQSEYNILKTSTLGKTLTEVLQNDNRSLTEPLKQFLETINFSVA